MTAQRINPRGLEQSPYCSQATLVPAGASMLYIGGQSGIDASGALVGNDDAQAQSKQAMGNVIACLSEVGGEASDLVALEITVADGVDCAECQRGIMSYLDPSSLPNVRVCIVPRLARESALVEIAAVAAVVDASEALWMGTGEAKDPAWF